MRAVASPRGAPITSRIRSITSIKSKSLGVKTAFTPSAPSPPTSLSGMMPPMTTGIASPTPSARTCPRTARAHRLDARALEAEVLTLHAGRRAVLAERLAQRIRPLAGRDPRARAGDRGGHQVLARPGGLPQAPESRVDLALAPPALGGAHHLERLGGRRGVKPEEPAVRARHQPRGQPLRPPIAADDHDLAPVDARQALG